MQLICEAQTFKIIGVPVGLPSGKHITPGLILVAFARS